MYADMAALIVSQYIPTKVWMYIFLELFIIIVIVKYFELGISAYLNIYELLNHLLAKGNIEKLCRVLNSCFRLEN